MRHEGGNLIYALSNGKLVSVEDVPAGLKCDCFCPACGEQLGSMENPAPASLMTVLTVIISLRLATIMCFAWGGHLLLPLMI